MRRHLLAVAVFAVLYVPAYAALSNACRGSDLGHSTPLVVPRAILALPLVDLHFRLQDEGVLHASDPEIDLRNWKMVLLLLANGALWGCPIALAVEIARRVVSANQIVRQRRRGRTETLEGGRRNGSGTCRLSAPRYLPDQLGMILRRQWHARVAK
jgi:hypothetical protein